MYPEQRRRKLQVALAVLGTMAVFAPVWFYGTVSSLFACDGAGGVPYAARSSTVGGLCLHRQNPVLLTSWYVLVAAAVVAVVTGCMITLRRRRTRPALIGLAVGALFMTVYAGPFLFLSDSCSRTDQAAYERWLKDPNRPKLPPADCANY